MRGQSNPEGHRIFIVKTGYSKEKRDGIYRFLHHWIAEDEILHRPLEHDERVEFIDRRYELRREPTADNLKVVKVKHREIMTKIELLARVEELEAENQELQEKVQTKFPKEITKCE